MGCSAAVLQVARGASAAREGASQQREDEASWGYPPGRIAGSGRADSVREFIACQRKCVALVGGPLLSGSFVRLIRQAGISRCKSWSNSA